MARPVRHKRCGKLVASYLGHAGFSLESRFFVRLDGSSPLPGERFQEQCPHCARPISGPKDLDIEGLAVQPQDLAHA